MFGENMPQFHFKTDGNTILFYGELTEQTDDALLTECITKSNTFESLSLDFSEVDGANSNGIIKLTKYLNAINASYNFINTPIWLLESFSMVSGLIKDPALVSTVRLPFYSEDEDKEIVKVFEIGKDIPILDDYSNFELDDIEQEGVVYSAEFDESMIFSFLKK
jgi:hypothetical protein